MNYDKDTDYQAKINEAVKAGDYESAAKYEQSRNEKIDGEGLDYEKTNRFSGWLDTTDYSNLLREQMNNHESREKVSKTLKNRIRKSSGTEGLTQYAYDDVYDAAIKYLMGGFGFSDEEKKPVFKNDYDSELKKLYRELSSKKEFSYNPWKDDLYKYYKEQYNREGKRAMEDLLGELSSNTGGIASSYAVNAAAQSLDYYNSKLTDKIPELYQGAYERYVDDIMRTERNFGILKELSNEEYNRYLDRLNQYNTDRQFDYNNYLESIALEAEKENAKWEQNFKTEEAAREEKEKEREYEYLYDVLSQEAEENSRKWANQEEESKQKEEQDKIENALRKWENMGYLDEESANILGLPVGLHTVEYDYKKAQQHKLYKK